MIAIARTALVAATLVACANPSSLDSSTEKGKSADPWATGSSSPHKNDRGKHKKGDKDKDKDDGGGPFGGFDVPALLAKIRESLETPGPYEAPDKSADYDENKPHWGVMQLHGAIVERETISFLGSRGTELVQLRDRLRTLAKDEKLVGLVVRVAGLEISVPDAVELRAAMHDFRAAGKHLRCHVENADQGTYQVLAACETIGLAPLGDVAITGPVAMPIHLKQLLDKLGVQADFIHVGAYKGAAEPLTLDAPSKQMEETLGAILDQRYATMVATIATERKLAPDAVKGLIDTGLFEAEAAKNAKLVDEVAPFEQFRDAIGAPWTKLPMSPDRKDSLSAMLKLARFVGAMPQDRPLGDHVAVVYALGNIVDGSDGGVLGARTEIASQTLVAALRALGNDPSVKAIVLRVDSGGGSAQASELIWREVNAIVAKKPVIVSMSDVAASGGYYISAGATKIFALDDTLTGSIGVVGGHLALAGALQKVGVATFPMGRGKRATMMVSLRPWNPDERDLISKTMDNVYKVFVARVAAGRHMTPEQVDKIAAGRVWTGAKAKELGLVDAIGGLDDAIAEAKKLAKVESTELEVYPPSPSLRDLLVNFGQVQAPFLAALDAGRATAAAIDPRLARAADQLVELALSFRSVPVQTLAIVPDVR